MTKVASTEIRTKHRRWLRLAILALMVGGFWEPLSLYAGIALFAVYVFSK